MSSPAPAPTGTDPQYRFRWLILAVMLTAEIMDLLDSTVVNVAGPSLRRSLGASATDLQWIIGGYPLALGAGLILGGRLGDRFGRRRMFLIGLIGFTLASLLCAIAPTVGFLITVRLVQGAFGAALLPQGIGLLRAAFPPAEIGRAFGVFGPAFGLAGIFGPLIGGGLVQADLFGSGWRLVFVVNIPIGVAAAVIAWIVLPRGGADRAIGFDLVGALIVVGASGLVVLPLIQGQALGWPAWTYVSLVAGVVGYVAFGFQQRIRGARGGVPLVVPSILKKSQFLVGLGGLALFFAGLVGVQLILTLFLQLGEGFSAGQAGLSALPIALGSAVGGGVSGGLLADRLGRSVIQIGAAVELAGAVILFLTLHAATFSIWQLVPGLFVAGLGTGLAIAALFNVLIAAVDDAEAGSASGVLTAVQSIASSIGVAVFGTVFFGQVSGLRTGSALTSATGPEHGFQDALLLQTGLLLAFLVLSVFFPRRARSGEQPTAVDESATTRAA